MNAEEFETRMAILKWLRFDPFVSPTEGARRRLTLRGIKVPCDPLTREGIVTAVLAAYRERIAEAQAAAKLPPPVPVEVVGGVPLYHASLDTIYLLDRIKAEPGQEWTPEQARAVAYGLSDPDKALAACASRARGRDVFAEAAEYLAGFPNVNLSELTARCAALVAQLYEGAQKSTP
jgi:hypothetical protein